MGEGQVGASLRGQERITVVGKGGKHDKKGDQDWGGPKAWDVRKQLPSAVGLCRTLCLPNTRGEFGAHPTQSPCYATCNAADGHCGHPCPRPCLCSTFSPSPSWPALSLASLANLNINPIWPCVRA